MKKQRLDLVSTITSWTRYHPEVSRGHALGIPSGTPCVHVIDLVEGGLKRAGTDNARRLEMASEPIKGAVGELARKVSSAPKKRADPIAITPPRKTKHAKHRITGKSEPKATDNKKKSSPTHLFKGSGKKGLTMTRKCVMSRAFKAEHRRASDEGCTFEVIKERRGKAFREAGAQWDLEHSS